MPQREPSFDAPRRRRATQTSRLAPALAVVRSRSVGELDVCEEEIARQCADQYPPAHADLARILGRAS